MAHNTNFKTTQQKTKQPRYKYILQNTNTPKPPLSNMPKSTLPNTQTNTFKHSNQLRQTPKLTPPNNQHQHPKHLKQHSKIRNQTLQNKKSTMKTLLHQQ